MAEDRLVWMNQVHGTGVAVVDGPQDGRGARHRRASSPPRPAWSCACWSPTACPVLLADHETGVVAAVHAGREGVRQGVVPAALSAMASLGARARHVTALLGPAVCGACYEVPAEMQREVARVAPAAAVRTRRGTPGLDLRAGIAEGLRRAGIPEVVQDPRCTVEDPSLFSHRRDGVTGRQAGLVWLGLIARGWEDHRHDRPGGEPACGAGADRRRRAGGRPRAVVGARCSR